MVGLFDFLFAAGPKRTPKQEVGDAGEQAAAKFLKKQGYRIVDRNFTCPRGEVDLVALEKRSRLLCFVEVRSRTLDDGRAPQVSPEESVTPAKRRRVILAARKFLAERRARGYTPRFDVITVRFDGDDRRRPDIRHYPAAFDATGQLM